MSDTPAATPPENSYHAYLLRVWRAGGDGCAWQASLQDSKTGARIGFASLEGLFAYLMQTTEANPAQSNPHSTEKRSL